MAPDPPNSADGPNEWQHLVGGNGVTKWRPRLFWIIACGLSVALLALIYSYPDGKSPLVSSVVARSLDSPKQPVQVEAEITDSVLAEKGAALLLRIEVTNQSKQTIPIPSLRIFAPGFSFTSLPPCKTPVGPLGKEGLGPGNSCSFELPLRAAARTGAYWITSIVSWGDATTDSVSLRLGPVRFEGMFGAAQWARFGHRLAEILKDLTLPLLLFFLTNYYTSKQKEREDAAERAQERRTQRQQIRQLLLNQVMEAAQKHYMPITSCSVVLLRELEKIEENASDASVNHLLFQALTLVRLLDLLRRERGGFFLKSLEAEKIVGYSWQALKEVLFSVLTEEQVDLAISNPSWLVSYSVLAKYINLFRVARTRLDYWIKTAEPNDGNSGRNRGTLSEYAGLIDIMQAVLRHEVNYPLMEDWYEEAQGNSEWKFIRETTILPTTGDLSPTQKDTISFVRERLTPYCGRKLG